MALPINGPTRRGLIGVDHLEHIGGRERHIEHMLSHQRQMAEMHPRMKMDAPVAAFEGGTRRTPKPVPNPTHKRDEFAEVREAWRRIIVSKPVVNSNRAPAEREGSKLAKNLSRNRQMGSKQYQVDQAHAAELHHLQRRIASNQTSLNERKKNKLDASLCTRAKFRLEARPPEEAARTVSELPSSSAPPAFSDLSLAHPQIR